MSEGKGTGAGPATAGGSTKGNRISGGAAGEKVVKIAGTGTVTLPSRKSLVPKVERLSEEKEELKRAARVVPWPKRGGVLKFRTSFTNTVLDVMTEKGWERTQVSILYTSIRIYSFFVFFVLKRGMGEDEERTIVAYLTVCGVHEAAVLEHSLQVSCVRPLLPEPSLFCLFNNPSSPSSPFSCSYSARTILK